MSAQQKVDITYRNSTDGLFTSFFPDTPEGEKAWNIINATPGAEGGKVLAAHAEPTIEQLRKAGYTVEGDTSAPSAVDDDALLAELSQSDINTEFAENLGKQFAGEINGSQDADNWSPLERGDDAPEFDYIELRTHYGDMFEENSVEIERAYKAGFNSVFIPPEGRQ